MPLSRDLLNPSVEESTFRLQFNGRGGEYFGIWLANLSLSIITLGIYSPWAKVRRLRYFYQHTNLLGTSFDFHGDPFRILIGRFIALILLVIYSVLSELESAWQMLAFGMLLVCAPFIIQRALRFRLRSTSYRGLRFNFVGTLNGALVDGILLPFISAIPLGLTYPFGLRQWRRYQLRNSAYGKTKFGFDSSIVPFYIMGIASIAPLVFFTIGTTISVIVFGFTNGKVESPVAFVETLKQMAYTIGPVVLVVGICALLSVRGIYSYFKHRIIYNGLTLGRYRFRSTIELWPCVYTFGTNSLFSALTLGLYRPFAAIRATKLQLENIEITGPTDVGTFIGENAADVSALGTEAVDFFDFDIGL